MEVACLYCVDQCQQQIPIPYLFFCMNAKKKYSNWNTDYHYHEVITVNKAKASDCILCGRCEAVCPQHLKIRELMKEVSKEFDINRITFRLILGRV